MGVAAKAKFGLFGFLALAVVLAVGMPAIRGYEHKGDKEVFTFEVIVEPDPRSREFAFEVFYNGKSLMSRMSKTSWKQSMQAKRGDQVALNAVQVEAGKLTCMIYRSSDLAVFTHATTDPGSGCHTKTT